MSHLKMRISSQSVSALFCVAPDTLVTSHPFHVMLQLLTESLHKTTHKYPKYDTNNPVRSYTFTTNKTKKQWKNT